MISTAIPADNVELVRARDRGQTVLHRSELLAELCAAKRLIAVAGAHGKTSTSGMLAHALASAGAEPAFLLGGELPGAGPAGAPANAGWGSSDWVVAEADESDGSFLRLEPEVAVVTNVELDHHSHWGGERELIAAFATFTGRANAVVRPAEERLAAFDGGGSVLSFAVAGADLHLHPGVPWRWRRPISRSSRAEPSSRPPRRRSVSGGCGWPFPVVITSPTRLPRSGLSSPLATSIRSCRRSRS